MPTYSFREFVPVIPNNVFIAPSADVIGRVSIGENASVWHQSVVRGDVDFITIGANTNIQDRCLLHVTKGFPLVIGSQVSVGHSVTLHGCTIEDHALIGMGAIIMDGAFISHHSVVAGGAVVPPGKKYPPFSMIMGNPAVVKRSLTEAEIATYGQHFTSYVKYKDEYLDETIVKLLKK
jgi:carbonic anhydrase/acetyltransferase-like protein (isoleucine patch superfamily)